MFFDILIFLPLINGDFKNSYLLSWVRMSMFVVAGGRLVLKVDWCRQFIFQESIFSCSSQLYHYCCIVWIPSFGMNDSLSALLQNVLVRFVEFNGGLPYSATHPFIRTVFCFSFFWFTILFPSLPLPVFSLPCYFSVFFSLPFFSFFI